MDYDTIFLQINDGIATIQLNRPKAHNALCTALNEDMENALEGLCHDPDVRVLIITGGEKVFAAGADIKEMMTATPNKARDTSAFGHKINNMIESLPFPVIAAVCGFALGGGCELALACDFRILGKSAHMGLPEVGLGILPGAGGTQRLIRLIGASRAKEMIFLGTNIKADKALEMGLATSVVADDAVMDEALSLARELAEKPAVSLMLAKQAVQYGEEHGLAEGKLFENMLFGLSFSSPDQLEGMTAFLERRIPQYTNSR